MRGNNVWALLGTSTTTTYAESTAGIAEGGRSGLTALLLVGCSLSLCSLPRSFVGSGYRYSRGIGDRGEFYV